MSDNNSQPRSFPVERFPGPVCRYCFRDGTPIIRGVNPVFENQFGVIQDDVTLEDAFDALHFDIVGGDATGTTLENNNQIVVESTGTVSDTGSERYLVTNVPPSDEESGFLVFVEATTPELVGDTASTLDADNIATIISHDIRNPLDVAKSRLHAGRQFDEDEHFEHVEWAHERMERIIDDVLTLARVGQSSDQDESIELEDVVRTAWRTVETNEATITVQDGLPRVAADSDRVLRLFENLFRNCVEHGPTSSQPQSGNGDSDTTGGGTPPDSEAQNYSSVSVTVGPMDSDSSDGFYVADDGSGIPPGERTAIFDPGYSLDGDGTGIGLSIVSRIVDVHGWSIDVTTSADGGARFEITGLEVLDSS